MAEDAETAPEPEALATALRPDLLKVFPPALLGRLIVLPYYPLSPEMLGGIVRLQLEPHRQAGRGEPQDHADLRPGGDRPIVVSRCTEVASGGRMIDAILTNTMLPTLSTELLGRMAEGRAVSEIRITDQDGELAYEFVEADSSPVSTERRLEEAPEPSVGAEQQVPTEDIAAE